MNANTIKRLEDWKILWGKERYVNALSVMCEWRQKHRNPTASDLEELYHNNNDAFEVYKSGLYWGW